MVWLVIGCSELSVDSGTADEADLCAWAEVAWRETFANECDAETEREGIEGCYDALVVTIEPIEIDTTTSVVDFAACLKSDQLRVYDGEVEVWSGSLNQAEGSLPGYLSADDGLDPCFGFTAGLAGDYTGGATFTSGSYWWDNGDDEDAVGDEIAGSIGPEADDVVVSTPVIEYLGMSVELGLGDRLALPRGTKDHWDTPECGSEKGGGA